MFLFGSFEVCINYFTHLLILFVFLILISRNRNRSRMRMSVSFPSLTFFLTFLNLSVEEHHNQRRKQQLSEQGYK